MSDKSQSIKELFPDVRSTEEETLITRLAQLVEQRVRDDIASQRTNAEKHLSTLSEKVEELTTAARTNQRQASLDAQVAERTHIALTKYGEAEQLAVIKSRLKLHPKFANLPEGGLELVAQYAQTLGVNPFTHVEAWPDEITVDGQKRKIVQIDLNYKGLLHLMPNRDMWDYRFEKLSEQEMLDRGTSQTDIDNGAISVRCILRNRLKAAQDAADRIDHWPIIGRGVFYPVQEMQGKNGPYKKYDHTANGRDPMWRAEIRALKDATNQIGDFGFNPDLSGGQFMDMPDGVAAYIDEPEPESIDPIPEPFEEGVFTESNHAPADLESAAPVGPESPESIHKSNTSKAKVMCANCGVEPANDTGYCSESCAAATGVL